MKSEVSVRKLVEKGGANGAGLPPCSGRALRKRHWKAPEWATESGSPGTSVGGGHRGIRCPPAAPLPRAPSVVGAALGRCVKLFLPPLPEVRARLCCRKSYFWP